MARQLKEIKRRIVNTRQIRRVTGTLQRVSAARLPGDRRAVQRESLYINKLSSLIRKLHALSPGAGHPYLRQAVADRPGLVIAFGTERGLCGGLNSNLAARFKELADETSNQPLHAVAVGKIINRRLRRMGAAVDLFVAQPAFGEHSEIVDGIFSFLDDGYRKGIFGEVYVLYSRSVSAFRQIPTQELLLPVAVDDSAETEFAATLFEPEPARILFSLLPEYVRETLEHAFLLSQEAEDAARQAAMSRATENAGKILESLRRQYSRLRQENITTEMIELAGGG